MSIIQYPQVLPPVVTALIGIRADIRYGRFPYSLARRSCIFDDIRSLAAQNIPRIADVFFNQKTISIAEFKRF